MNNKSKTLVIVESPAKAEKIQSFLTNDYIVMASKGHITELAKGGKHGIGVNIDNNFKPHYVLSDDKVNVLDALLNAGKKCDMILLATDDDREGTAISWHLSERLKDLDKPMKRVKFNEIKKAKILKAISSPEEIDMNVVHAQEARRILDRLVGFTASPFLMQFFGNNLSAGRVQSVVTKMVVDREREIESFVPEDFYTIQVSLKKDVDFQMKFADRITDKNEADKIKNKLSNTKYIVSESISKDEEKYPLPPLITSTLQRLMSKLYGISADRTMKAAQALYELGFCTYIRTDSVRASDEAIEDVREFLKNKNLNIPKKPYVYKNKDASQDAHECIRPSDLNIEPTNNYSIIDPDEKLVYETIYNYFLASQMVPAVYSTLKITAHPVNEPKLLVKASGKTLKSKGFLEVLGINDESKIEIPMLNKKDELELYGNDPIKVEKKQTQAPPRFSEDKLIKFLEDKSIGRPATYAELLSKITSRNYVEKKGSVFHATELGKKITDVLDKFFTFMDYNYSSNMEHELDKIEHGKLDHVQMLKNFYPSYKKELERAYIDNGGTICDKCGNPMSVRIVKASGVKFLSCSNFKFCKNTKNLS
jgi:DNA topoisomerase-1